MIEELIGSVAEDKQHLKLSNGLGIEVRLPLFGPVEIVGGIANRMTLKSGHLRNLARAARFSLLRQCRHLLAPGGRLGLPDDQSWTAMSSDLAQTAWACGFTKEIVPGVGETVLTKPSHQGGHQPLVSILIPAYKAEYLAESLSSALAQTYNNCEIIICDDSGGEDVAAVVNAVTRQFGHALDPGLVRYIRNPENLGGQGNYLRCFAEARGQYIKFLNDDDVLAANCVESMAGCLADNPAVTLVTSYRQLIDENGDLLPDEASNQSLVRRDTHIDGRHLATKLLTEKINHIGEPTTVMFRKQDMIDNQPHLFSFDGTVARRNGDTFIWAALLSRGDAVYLAAPLSQFRLHEDQVQRSPDFVKDALLVWDELAAQARTMGLVHSSFDGNQSAYPLVADRALAEDFDPQTTSPVVMSLLEKNRYAEAVAWLRSRLHQDPGHVRLRSDLGSVLWAWGNHDLALTETLLALRPDPDETTFLNLREMLAAMGQGEQAEALEQKMALSPA